MPTPTTPDPAPQPPAAALAAPCRDCGTTGGSIPAGSRRPTRKRGLCARCYNRRLARGQLPLGHHDCLSCAATGRGGIRGLCATCYERALGQGIHRAYPACGRVPVPYLPLAWDEHPAPIPPGLSPILRPDPAAPVWVGLTLPRYTATIWTPGQWRCRPRDPWAARLHDRDLAALATLDEPTRAAA
jgi:hypothetical protein